MPGRILFADNNKRTLKSRGEILQDHGYEVRTARTFEEAVERLNTEWFHLALLDLRMDDDKDEMDRGGLDIVQDDRFEGIAKIIMTGFPTSEVARLAMLNPGVSFLGKDEGAKAMLDEVQRAFREDVRIDWDLAITWKAMHHLDLINQIMPGLEDANLLQHAHEFEDLLRKVFYGENRVHIERHLWSEPGRAAFVVHSFKLGEMSKSCILICGLAKMVTAARDAFELNHPPGNAMTSILSHNIALRFGMTKIALRGIDIPNVQTLQDVYRTETVPRLRKGLNNLFVKTLSRWHSDRPIVEDGKSVTDYFSRLTRLDRPEVLKKLHSNVQVLAEQAPTLNAVLTVSKLNLIFGHNGHQNHFPNPLHFMEMSLFDELPAICYIVPGQLTANNLLMDQSNQVWLTDFMHAGKAPKLWNYVELEAAMRFDWVETADLFSLIDFLTSLQESPFEVKNATFVGEKFQKATHCIDIVRRLAMDEMVDERSYSLGLFFQALSRVAAFEPNIQLLEKELARATHALITAAMLAQKLSVEKVESPLEKCLRIEHEPKQVFIGRKELKVTSIGFEILWYLYERQGELCRREVIIEHIYGVKIADLEPIEKKKIGKLYTDRLNTAIRRLRNDIGDDPKETRYVHTKRSVGYMLTSCPV